MVLLSEYSDGSVQYIRNGNSTYVHSGEGLSYFALTYITLEAVFQTVIVCFFGFAAAYFGILTPTAQKQLSHLNVQLLTPCLIFTKLASSLSLSALIDIAVIPVFFVLTTSVSYGCAKVVSRVFKFNLPEANFVTAMAVFGNSNSLPVSLTVSLAYSLPDLLWPDLKDDNQDDVASRGILYLLIFQQLGQIVRWSWGYNTLLARPVVSVTAGSPEYMPARDEEESIADEDYPSEGSDRDDATAFETHPRRSSASTKASLNEPSEPSEFNEGNGAGGRVDSDGAETPLNGETITRTSHFELVRSKIIGGWNTFLSFMNIPLWAMIIAIVVASIPPVKEELFVTQGFINKTFTKAVAQLGSVAIPMILLVLGSNLAPNDSTAPPSKNYKKLVFASLLCRMVLPAVILLPIIAFSVRFIKISILDDPIFLIVAFILTVSPPAIQLSQICQLNEVFEREMSGVLFWGYVILTLPFTIIIVVTSLEVLDWAGTTRS